MCVESEISLGKAEIADLSSRYIDEGVKVDAWEILNINISGRLLKAEIGMVSYFVSPTDPDGFHLTIFSTQEFLAQLANIYLLIAAGFKTKCRETWMRECSITSRRVIRNPEKILVEMDFTSLKKIQDSVISMANCRVYDDQGGLFTARIKGLLR
jgi:hypothetical protein